MPHEKLTTCTLPFSPHAVWSADDWYKNTLVEGDDAAKLADDEMAPADTLDPTKTS